MAIRANVDLTVDTTKAKRSMDRAAREINKIVNGVAGKDINFNVNGKSFTQPLGRITASANEFTKSLEASNARVIAFGASVGIINSITDSFKFLVAETIRFEKTLQDINVVLNSSNEQIQKFGQGLFDVAQNTAQSFNIAADAALEFSRQGLSVEEVLKRTNDALTLTRITSLDAAEAVSGLTAAVNAFGNAGLTTTDIIDKLAAVDVKFAVSSEDLINGLERSGAVAIDAGVSLDSLVGIITSLQQTTARGGAVIGNGLKTIFTRIQRPESLRQLEDMGIAVRGLTGAILPADQVLKSIAKSFDDLTQAQQSNIVQFSAGIFQANIFRAALTDLAKAQGIQQQATQISANAAGEAARKNELLNKSISAMASQAGTGLKELVGIMGELAIKPELGDFVSFFGARIEELKNSLGGGEDEGNAFAKGLVRGIGNILTGPGIVAFAAIFSKLLFNVFKFASSSLKDVLGIVTQKEKIRQIEESIVRVLGSNVQVTQSLNRLEGDRAAQEQYILGIIEAQTNALAKQQQLASQLGPALLQKGISPDLSYNNRPGRLVDIDGDGSFRSGGLLPEEKNKERKGAIDGGYSPGRIAKMKVPGMGEIIYNTAEKVKNFQGMKQPAIMPPESSKAGKKYKEKFADKHGFDPYASGGFIPNFAQQIGNTLLMKPSKFLTYANSTDVAKALGKGVNYRDIERKMDLEQPVSIKASLLDIITSSDKNKKKPTGQETLYDTFNSLASKGIAFIERDFLFRPLTRGGARKRKGESKTDFAERKTTAQLNAEQAIRETAKSTFTKYLSTHDPETNKGDASYPIDHIAKGLEFPSGETKSGEFIAANLISKSLRMASDRELTSWLESQGGKDKGLNEKNLKRAQNLASQLGIKGTRKDKSGNLYFGQEDADIWGMNKGFVPNFITVKPEISDHSRKQWNDEKLRNWKRKYIELSKRVEEGTVKPTQGAMGEYVGTSATTIAKHLLGKDEREGGQSLHLAFKEEAEADEGGEFKEAYYKLISALQRKGAPEEEVKQIGKPYKKGDISWEPMGSYVTGSILLSKATRNKGGYALSPFKKSGELKTIKRYGGEAFSDTFDPSDKKKSTEVEANDYIQNFGGIEKAFPKFKDFKYDYQAKIMYPYIKGKPLSKLDFQQHGVIGNSAQQADRFEALIDIGKHKGGKAPLDFINPNGEAKFTSGGIEGQKNFNKDEIGIKILRSEVGNNKKSFKGLDNFVNSFKKLQSKTLKTYLFLPASYKGLIPSFASTTLYRGTSPKYDKGVRDIPNPPQFLFDEIMAAKTKSDFIKAVKKLGISHSMGAYSGSYNDGMYAATIEQMRGYEKMGENQILHGGHVYPRPMRGGFGKQEGVDLTPRHQPSGFVSRTVDKDVARSFAKSTLPGYEYDPNEMGNVDEVSVPNKRIFDQTKLEKYIDRFGLENVKKSFKEGMRKGTLKDIYLNLHKFRPKVQSTDPLDMFSPNAGESDRSIGMSGGSLTQDEKEITHIWSKRSPYFGQHKGLIPNFNVNLSNGYHDKKAIEKAIGKVYKSKTGSNLKKQDLSFAVERYISAIKDKQADDSDGYISSYPGGHFTAGGQKFNFNEISMALLGHGQFHKSFKNKGFIPNFAQKIRNGAIYHSKSNNKAVRVKRAHQAEQIAYIKHHGQDHMFESEVPFSDLIPATKEQIQEYLQKKSAGLIPNFAQKIRNGAIYHSKSNNKAVRVKRAHQAEQIAYIKHHGQDHMFESEVPFSDLIPATKEQIQEYLRKKSAGLIPNFFNLNRRNLSDKDKMSDRQLLLKKWQDKMSQIAPYAKQIKQGGARAEIDPIISKLNAEANAIWDELQKLKKGKDYYIPNYADPLQEAIQREESAGVPKSKIRIEKSSQLKSPMNPMGLAVTNTRDEPGGIAQGIRRAKEQRMDPKKYGASKGLVPNFMEYSPDNPPPPLKEGDPIYSNLETSVKNSTNATNEQTEATEQQTKADKKNIKASGDNLTKLFFFQSTLSMANGFLQEFAETGSGATRNLASFGESVSNIAGSFIQQKTLIDEVLEQTGQQGQGIGFRQFRKEGIPALGKGFKNAKGVFTNLEKFKTALFSPLKSAIALGKGFARFLPLVGQAFTVFTIVNEVVKKFSSSLAKIPIFSFLGKLEEGEGILDLFKSSADRAKSSLEKLSKQGEILSSTLEQITKIEEKQTQISELQALGSKRTNKEDQQLFQAEIDLLEAQNNLEKKLNEAILNIKDKELSSKIEGIINKGIDTVEVKKLLEDLQKQNMQGQVARTISAGFLERADKKDFDFDEIINRSELNMVGSRSVKALDENQLEMAAAGDISSVEKLMPQLFKKINENKRNYGVLAKAVQVAAKKQLEENNVRKQIAEAAVDSKKLLDREYFLMDQRYKNALLRNSLAEKIVDSEQKILDANQKILLEKGVLSQSQGISSEFSLKQQRIDFDLNKKINDARQKALQDILKATKETITFDFGPDAREGKPISDILNFNIDGKARKNIEDDLGIEFKDDDVQKVQDLFNSLSKELEGVQDATSATVKIAQKYKDISDSNVATLFALGLTEANLYGTKTKSLDTVKKALAEEDAALLNARMSAAIQMQSLAEEEKRAEISKKTVKGAEILAATYLKQGSIAQVQEKVAKSEVENRKGIVLNLALQNKIEEKKLAQLKTSGVLLEQSIVEQVKKNRAEAESSELSLNQTLAQIMILTSLEKESDVRKTAEAVLENKFKSEIANAELAAIEAEKREEFFGIQQNLNALAQAQVASEQSNARVAAQLNLEKLKILTKNEGINAEVETQLKEEITSTQKTALLTASKALLLSHNKKQAELLQKANTLQELSNKYTEAENAIRQANISNAELSTNTGLGLITEKAQAFSETRSAGERALQTGDPKDMLAYAQKLEQTNKLFGTGTEVIDRLRVKMAEMSESASNLKAELVETGIENLRGNMVQMFKDIGSGAKSVGEAYTDLGLGLAEAILDKMMQKNVDAIISNLTYAFTGVDEKSDAQTISESNNLLSNSLDSAAKAMQSYAEEIARLRNDVSYSVQDRNNGTIDGQGFSSQTFMDDIKNTFDGIRSDLQTLIINSGAKSNSLGLQTTGGSDKPFENFEARSEEVLKNFVDNFATKSGVLGEHLFTSLESAITRALGNTEPKSIVPTPQVTAQTESKEESNKAEGTTNEEKIEAQIEQESLKDLEKKRVQEREDSRRYARSKQAKDSYLESVTKISEINAKIAALEEQDLNERLSRRESKRTRELEVFSDNKSSKSTKTTDKFWGGKIQRFAKGGLVEGPGGMDNVPAMLTAGEYVVPREEVQKFEKGGKLGKRITRGLKGAAQGAVMTMTADAINKAMGKTAKKESPPTFNMNRLEPTKLGSSVSMAVSDPRMSGRVLAQSQTIQDYKDFLLEKAAFETRKKNEKASKKMGVLSSALGAISSYAMAGITSVIKKPLEKAVSFAKAKVGSAASFVKRKVGNLKGHMGLGEHSDAFKHARRSGYKVSYKDVAESFESGESLIVQNSKTKAYNELKPITSQDGGIFDTYLMKREVDFDKLESVNKYANNFESTYKLKGATENGKQAANIHNLPEYVPPPFTHEVDRTENMPNFQKSTVTDNRLFKNSGGKIPAMLTAGEGFIPSKLAQKIGYQNLESMNKSGSMPIIQGDAGIDRVGPVGLDEGDFIIRKSSTDKLMRDNPKTMRFAMQNPDGFRRAATGYYEGGIVGTTNQSGPSLTQSNAGRSASEPVNRIQPLIESTQSQQTERVSSAPNNETTNNINVNVTIDGSGKESVDAQTPEGSYEQEQELAMKIKTKVLEVIRQEKRLGGELDK